MPRLLRFGAIGRQARFCAIVTVFITFGLFFVFLNREASITVIPHEKLEPVPPSVRRANATFVVLCRHRDLYAVLHSMEQVEKHFNWRYGYPWLLLNDEPFGDRFKRKILKATSSSVSFGLVSKEQWDQPEWIDEEKAAEARKKMTDQGVLYADSVSYRNMCRFQSGHFFQHPLVQQYRYYWRVEPAVEYFCDIDDDPFIFMERKNKIYGFTIAIPEYPSTIPTLWATVKEFIKEYPQYVSSANAMSFLSDDGGETYNNCHFWSNFEIADMDFFRSEPYQKFFEFLDRKGGFYYERWGDAPIHSIAVALLAPKEQLHFFSHIGYGHAPHIHCPRGREYLTGRCNCSVWANFDYNKYSCLPTYEQMLLGS